MWSPTILTEDFNIVVKAKHIPFVVLVDDSLYNFSASHNTLGLFPKKHDDPIKLSFFAKRYISKMLSHIPSYDGEGNGISLHGISVLTEAVASSPAFVKRMVLDWDKTLTLFSSFKTTIVNKYTVQYYFGGYKRMRALRKLFRVLKVWNIDTCILTNNSRAKREPDSFTKALSFIGASWVEIIHTSDTKMSYMKKKQWI